MNSAKPGHRAGEDQRLFGQADWQRNEQQTCDSGNPKPVGLNYFSRHEKDGNSHQQSDDSWDRAELAFFA
ncbi:MAG TPA: hypothetical protein VFE89_16635 [Beijerinckiaceae bacterium]|nr:hypothetical protein [Beijerinckiaceae bacterium]